MKKLLFVLALGAFAACGSGDTKEATADSTANAIDSSANVAKDSVKATADSTVKTIDSSANAAKDSVKH
ncbi:hypothetical protein HNQ91_005916 [Filimonas zeae]|uniref:Entericidin n=1 Tax=Filimonas zeae TaxID=1737353 RepID=A0A917J401_9BACT|nr:hypothetical protein [Filimonas zeae]MDR6342829.1 hypothetical protein [Filimonas zeae]GGH82863.1 hypothetical protein GCM10011379_57390 [Filimonas zeae]